MKERPGMMLYFDNKDCIDALTDAEAGRLMKGLLAYACDGTLPRFDGALKLVWLMFKPKLDLDAERYFRHCRQKSYAVYCREQDKRKLPKLSFDEWLSEDSASDDIGCYPTTTATPKTNTTLSTAATASPTAAVTIPDGNRQYGGIHTCGKGDYFRNSEPWRS